MTGTRADAGTPRVGVVFVSAQPHEMSGQRLHEMVIRSLDRRRFAVFAAVAADFEGRESWARSLGRPLWPLPAGASMSDATGPADRARRALANAGLLTGVARVAGRMRRARVDVVHAATQPRDALSGVALAALGGARLVVHWHNAHSLDGYRWARLALSRADAIVAVSEVSRRSLLDAGLPPERIHVVYNGIDVRRFRPDEAGRVRVRAELGLADDEFVVVLPGRLAPEKGQAELLRAVAALRDRGEQVTALLVGDDDPWLPPGSQRAGLEALRDELGVADRVRFVPHRPDVPAVMAAGDVIAIPSHAEPFGLVVVEAMACGRPVVGASAGAIPEIVTDGETGVLVPVRDPAGLADGLARLKADPALRARVGARARVEVERRFSEERMAADLAALLADVAARPGA